LWAEADHFLVGRLVDSSVPEVLFLPNTILIDGRLHIKQLLIVIVNPIVGKQQANHAPEHKDIIVLGALKYPKKLP
jgi:hypothetical protein